ncbi:hypothetical protein [Halopenitus sp. POP-27]|uniref:hypothetical protein n=1 Tax=Halopenitus sp. POP-27 TaxID=2994425 RepID=UPI0024682F14|nr:hypothetical protein [Halopenitus sp. POP-27]
MCSPHAAVSHAARAVGVLIALAAVPGVAAARPVTPAGIDPSAVALAGIAPTGIAPATIAPAFVDPSSPVVRAAVSFLLVVAFGGGIIVRRRGLLDRAIADTMARPAAAVPYGLAAYGLAAFAGLYANDLLTRLGLAGPPMGYLAAAVLVVGLSFLGGLGFLVVGTIVTDLFGGRRARSGLLVGATLSAVGWLVLPTVGAVLVWVAVAAVGVGGRTRTWVHSSRTVPADVEG